MSLLEIDAFLEEDGQPFALLIESPAKSADAGDCFCRVHVPGLLRKDKSIHGVDAQQASELAIKFVRDLLLGKKLIDKDGNPVKV